MCSPKSVRGFVATEPMWQHFSGLGWASLGVLELTALPTIGARRWVPWVREADVLLVDIGGPAYAIDEQAAITVVDGSVDVVSEGKWTKFGPGDQAIHSPPLNRQCGAGHAVATSCMTRF